MVEKHYPEVLHLYPSFQKEVDTELVNSHLPRGAGGPLSFIPERFSVEELQKRQMARK